uniref:Protein FAR1-RELATED SEQUENCE n=1 Tax=Lactuca sativa TaxID=4236 RepID=A0A9R1UNF7_LACSA|nr:hypothetical protein LSAT_V11C800422000 [Lactuca sativa]
MHYLDDVWLKKYKEMFVSVWIDQHLNFGQRTNNRVESQHSTLKNFEKSMIVSKHEHKFSCFDLLRGNVSLKALDMLIEELQRVHQIDSTNCGCKLQNSCGLPCACMLAAYLNSDVFWRKLKISPSIPMENEDICGDGKSEVFKETYNKQPEAVKKSLMRKLLDIFHLSKTNIREPPTRHSSYITTILDLNVIPDLNEILDLKEKSDMNEIPDLKEEPQSCYNHRIIDEVQVMFHPYIIHIQDVEGDGNCGFRAISVCLGYGEDDWLYVRRQLLDELLISYDAYARVFTDRIKGDCPLPTISTFWIRHKTPCAAGWETMFMSCLELYRQPKPYNAETPFITIEDCF